MATLVLSAAGAAFGGSLGGSAFGVSSLLIGRAVGATIGSVVDQRLLGAGAAPVETGRIDRLRVMGANEGAPLPRCFGRMRVAGQLIWSSRFREEISRQSARGKGGGRPTTREYSYSVSIAIALCEGTVTRIGRIWADGQPIAQSVLTWRLHSGTEDQQPDPLIAAIEGSENAPAYRGTAYVVFENLDLASYGSRIPQFNFEVFRRPKVEAVDLPTPAALRVRGVALVPGTGEYSLATEPVYFRRGRGGAAAANVNNDRGEADISVSLDQMEAELPNCGAVSLVVSWFGNDLRADRCELYPAVEQNEQDGDPMRWRVSGITRRSARTVGLLEGRPVFGGTPSDEAVLQALQNIESRGLAAMFYPFILMDIPADNVLDNPWEPGSPQPHVPWRGRITLSKAPGVIGSLDKTAEAAVEVEAFFGKAAPSDFSVSGREVVYSGPDELSYRRFILHYAHLCAISGVVEAFCIGSEMRSLTQIRDGAASYPAVRELCRLAKDVRKVVGPRMKISYAADWSEYFGHHPSDNSGDAIFHLDNLWADQDIDFIGIDNYMPISDWRDGVSHVDVGAGSIYNLDYLHANVAGGEGFDWFYPDAAAREVQARQPIEDGAYGEPWIYRFKDIRSWWASRHFSRLQGVKRAEPTAWLPQSKPIWFTELGCPAVEKGTNQPNVFTDPKSSESFFPHYSNGQRDDFIQQRYLQAMHRHWESGSANPISEIYGGRMVDMSRAYVWAWDARPWPDFPARMETWVDGANYERGHWLNGRIGNPGLAEVVAEICERADLTALDVSELTKAVIGYSIGAVEMARQSLQPLMLAYGFDTYAAGQVLAFAHRRTTEPTLLSLDNLAVVPSEPRFERTREQAAEAAGRVTFGYVREDMDYQTGAAEAIDATVDEPSSSHSSLPVVLAETEAAAVVERWLAEARAARDSATFRLPPSSLAITAGDIVEVEADLGRRERYRVDRIEDALVRSVTALRVETPRAAPQVRTSRGRRIRGLVAPSPAYATFLDLPLLSGDEVPHAPHVAVTKRPWSGPISIYSANADFGYTLNKEVFRPAVIGTLLDPLPSSAAGLWVREAVRVHLDGGALQSRDPADVLAGANAAAVRAGDAGDWEVLQFARAELIAPQTYRLSDLLRGQAGTDGIMPEIWPAGSEFVLLDDAVGQLDLPSSARGLARHYRIGAASMPYDDPSYLHLTAAFEGVGLRPYRPAHLRADTLSDGTVRFGWVRRTRIDGDNWRSAEVPVGEDKLEFHVRLLVEGVEHDAAFVAEEVYFLDESTLGGRSTSEPVILEVAQVSGRFGVGPYASLSVSM